MTAHNWWMFVIGTVLICGTPGPNMLQRMTMSIQYGFRNSLYGMAGCFIAVFMLIAVSVAGVGQILKAFPGIYSGLCFAGALYLIYVGILAIRAPVGDKNNSEIRADKMDSRKIFKEGFLVGISNPKAMLFAVSFFPQFVNPHEPQAIQLVILLTTFSVIEVAWYMIYALGGRQLSGFMEKRETQRMFNILTGGLFILFGALLILKSH